MKISSLLIVVIFLSFINNVNAEQKIVYIDMDKVVSTSISGLSLLKKLNNINNKNLKFLKEEEIKLKDKETKLISQKSIISQTELTKLTNELKSEIKMYNQNRKKIITDFNKLKIDNTNNLLNLINPILAKFSDDEEISIILQKKDLVIGKTELDITDEIIKIIDTEIKEFKVK
mgnify:FL=1|tara:strand:- start:147 stop:668 length:522 start_codon:yes stop_codon:yes gene_type:complete